MGQLDEAIRAHLDLKRKHGASEEELEAEKQEALGPVRRESPSQPAAEPSPDFDVEDPAGLGEIDDELPATGSRFLDEPPAPAEASYEEPAMPPSDSFGDLEEDLPPEAFHEPVDPLAEPGFDQPLETEEEAPETVPFAESPAAVDPAQPTESLEPAAPTAAEPALGDTPPRGFDAVEEPEQEEGEDVLEETPDFLQETPEHDRLWFEQKPPRDFDFEE